MAVAPQRHGRRVLIPGRRGQLVRERRTLPDVSDTTLNLAGSEGAIDAHVWDNANAERIVVIAHGYGEHMGRYEHVAALLVERGAVVYGPDHLGHGTSEGPRALVTDFERVVDDLHGVIGNVRERQPDLPVVLIGHSMGGRAVVAAGDHPRVAGVLALAPWLPDGEPLTKLRPPVTFAHGTDDTITDPRATTAYADRLRAAGTPVTVYAVTDETHPMLHRATDWNTLVATFTAAALADSAPTAEDETESLPQYGRRSSLPAAVASIALARLRLPVTERFQVVKVAKARG